MNKRIAIGLVLALVVFTAVPCLAIAQISDSGQAAQVQYPDAQQPTPSVHEESDTGGGLPMTGYVAIPLLVTGGLLLLVGGVMHRRTRHQE